LKEEFGAKRLSLVLLIYGSDKVEDALVVPYTYKNEHAAAPDSDGYHEYGFYTELLGQLAETAEMDTLFELRQDLANGSTIDYFWSVGVASAGLLTTAEEVGTSNEKFFERVVSAAA
jgi:hypothetical protein